MSETKNEKKLFYKVIGNNFGNLTYTIGLNTDSIPFSEGLCTPGGIYFVDMENLPYYLGCYGHFIVTLVVPEDAQIISQGNKYKADRIEILKIETIRSFCKNNPEFVSICNSKYVVEQRLKLFLTTKEDEIIELITKRKLDVLYSPKISDKICEAYCTDRNISYPKGGEREFVLKRIYRK